MKIILMMATTVDGRIGRSADHFPDWTGSADKRLFAGLTRQAGAVIMGSRTYDTLGRPLAGRENIVLTRNPQNRAAAPNLVFTSQPPHAVVADLKDRGFTEAVLAGGAQINTLFAKARLIDEIRVTLVPRAFGAGPGLFNESLDLMMDLVSVQRLDDGAVCLHYRIISDGPA